MNKVLVDTSVWIEYFRGSNRASVLDTWIDENYIVTNALILTEILPFIKRRREHLLHDTMLAIEEVELKINWPRLREYQAKNLQHGINNVGIPDLIILQNVIDNDLTLFTYDKHFSQMERLFRFQLL